MVRCLNNHFFAAEIIRRGGEGRKAGSNGQDFAVARACPEGVVLVVSDGVSFVGDARSSAEVGAYLGAHLASRAALEMLERDPDGDVTGAVGRALFHGLRGLWTELPSDAAASGLIATLLVAIVTKEQTRIWLSGDGALGVTAPASTTIMRGNLDPRTTWQVTSPGPGAQAVRAELSTRRMSATAISESRRSPERAAGALHLALFAKGPVFSAWVATDGLEDEPAAARALELPVRQEQNLSRWLQRPDDADDLGIAWASERLPGMFQLGELGEMPHG